MLGVYFIRRLFLLLVSICFLSFIVFFSLRLVPGDPVHLVVSPFAPKELRDQVRERLGLDKPVYVQYLIFLRNAFQGDLGRSIKTGDSVLQEIGKRAPATLQLGLTALIISYVIALPLGIISAMKPESFVGIGAMMVGVIGISVPAFWLGLLLILSFSVALKWFPVTGYKSIRHLVLPSITLAAEGTALNLRMIRSSMLEVLRQDYIATARSKGISEWAVILKHALRNAMAPIITLLGLRIGWLIGGAIIVEMVFAWPGIGRLLVNSILDRDYPVAQAVMILLISCVVLGNLAADLLYVLVDPRIKYE